MTKTAHRRPVQESKPPVLLLAFGALVVIIGIGVVVAVVGGGEDGDTAAAPAFAPVAVEGERLPTYEKGAQDPSLGTAAPVVEGEAPDGSGVTIGGPGEPTLLFFVAHWCPHCQAEVPRLVEYEGDGVFEGVRTVAVLTGTNADAPNYPPVAWLEEEDWAGDVLLDDETFTAATAYGLKGYPFTVALNAEGEVVARLSGEMSEQQVLDLAEAVRGAG